MRKLLIWLRRVLDRLLCPDDALEKHLPEKPTEKSKLTDRVSAQIAFNRALSPMPSYICRRCWLAMVIAAGSGEPMCDCDQPIAGDVALAG